MLQAVGLEVTWSAEEVAGVGRRAADCEVLLGRAAKCYVTLRG